MSLNRREAIKRAAILLGGVLTTPGAFHILQEKKSSYPLDWSPAFFTTEQAQLVTALAETIIPSDSTPGAREAGVPAFIEDMVSKVYTEEQRARFMKGLEYYDDSARSAYGKNFVQCNSRQQFELASKFNVDALKNRGEPGFLLMKRLTMQGFFTSKIGATQVLQYEAIPGKYEGCLPLEEVGRAWAV